MRRVAGVTVTGRLVTSFDPWVRPMWGSEAEPAQLSPPPLKVLPIPECSVLMGLLAPLQRVWLVRAAQGRTHPATAVDHGADQLVPGEGQVAGMPFSRPGP